MTKQKLYRLPEETLKIISAVREERNIKTDTEALIYIITEYKNQKNFADMIADEIEGRNTRWIEQIKWDTKTAGYNSQILMDAVNSILYYLDLQVCYYVDEVKSTVIEKSEGYLKRKIEKRKQYKDNHKRKYER